MENKPTYIYKNKSGATYQIIFCYKRKFRFVVFERKGIKESEKVFDNLLKFLPFIFDYLLITSKLN